MMDTMSQQTPMIRKSTACLLQIFPAAKRDMCCNVGSVRFRLWLWSGTGRTIHSAALT
jgi:hypothetical protein